MYDMYPWGNSADSGSAEPRAESGSGEPRADSGSAEPRADSGSAEPRRIPEPRQVPADESAAATRAVQVALDRRDNGGDGVAAVGQATVGVTRQ